MIVLKMLVFTTSWCGPCKNYKQILATENELLADISEVEVIDIDEQPDRAKHWNIRSVPTSIIVDEKLTEIRRRSGAMNKTSLAEFVRVSEA